jgi:hypothetical protein
MPQDRQSESPRQADQSNRSRSQQAKRRLYQALVRNFGDLLGVQVHL